MSDFNPVQNFLQGLQGGQQIGLSKLRNALAGQAGQPDFDPSTSMDFQKYSAIDPAGASQMMKTFSSLSDSRKKAYFQDVREVRSKLESGDVSGALKTLTDRKGDVKTLKGDGRNTEFLYNAISGGEMPLPEIIANLRKTEQIGVADGFLGEIKDTPKAVSALDLAKLDTEKAKAAKYRAEVDAMKNPSPINPEFLKEERTVARDSVKTFNKRGNEVLTSYGKIDNILSGDGKLNRMKIASAMTSMARLLSPGIVTNQDFENLSNSANPASVLIDLLRGKGKEGMNVADELQRYGDPTNPDLFDKNSFLQTARQVAGAEVPSLISGYKDAQKRATRAGVSDRAKKTYFGENSTLTALEKMMGKSTIVMKHPILGDVTQAELEETAKNKGMTVDQVLAELEGAR